MSRRTCPAPCAAALALIAAGMVAVSGPALAADTATINGATTYQTMAGFGASEAFGQAQTVMNAPVAGAAAGAEPAVQPDLRGRA